jgi:hypothetical protein
MRAKKIVSYRVEHASIDDRIEGRRAFGQVKLRRASLVPGSKTKIFAGVLLCTIRSY